MIFFIGFLPPIIDDAAWIRYIAYWWIVEGIFVGKQASQAEGKIDYAKDIYILAKLIDAYSWPKQCRQDISI